MGDVLTADAKRAAEAVPGVDEAEVQMVFSPPWGAPHDERRGQAAARPALGRSGGALLYRLG
jgi:metal-sulfur cluster biosynthetic enzyme